jgi:hypothetical protein
MHLKRPVKSVEGRSEHGMYSQRICYRALNTCIPLGFRMALDGTHDEHVLFS